MIALRFKPLKNGKFSAYLDIYKETEAGKKQREYEFLKIYVSQDYSDIKSKVKAEDKENLELARTIKAKRQVELVKGEHGLDRKEKKSQINFLEFMEQQVRLKKTNPQVNSALLKILKSYVGQKQLHLGATDSNWCNQFRQFLLNEVSSNTVRSYLSALRLFLDIAVAQKLLSINPLVSVKIPTLREAKKTTLSLEELRLLASTPTNHNYQLREAFFFSCFTGLRLKDVRNLKWSDIKKSKLYLRIHKTPDKVPVLPLSEQAQKIINEIKREPGSELVFSQFFPVNRRRIGKDLEKWGVKAGITQHVHFHCARHTFATMAISSGIDIYTTQKLLTHSKIDSTQVYAKIVDEKKVQEVAKLPTL